LIDLVTTGRLSISEAAAQLGVPLSTASYWARKAAKEPQKPPKAAQARKPAKPTVGRPVAVRATHPRKRHRLGDRGAARSYEDPGAAWL